MFSTNSVCSVSCLEIANFNQELLKSNSDITILDYVKKINEQFYKIDISFIDDFISLVKKDECCIHHDMLVKYGVLTNIETTKDVRKMIENLTDDEEVGNVSHREEKCSQKINYYLHPRLFKLILIRSKNTKKYARYYLLLEEAISYYNDFQILKLQNKLKETQTLAVLQLEKFNTFENFVIFESNQPIFKYGIIKGSNDNIRDVKHDLKISDEDVIYEKKVPSASNFYKRIREKLRPYFERQHSFKRLSDKAIIDDDGIEDFDKELYAFYAITRNIRLFDITMEQFIEKIETIDNERFE